MPQHHILGADTRRPLDAVFVNSPLKDYDLEPRHNDFTLPVLGLGYIATSAQAAGFNVGVLDLESLGLGLTSAAALINEMAPRWVGLNLLAPTYRHSVALLTKLAPGIAVMLGGHQAKAMPVEILADKTIPRLDALVLGEGDSRVPALLADAGADLPHVLRRDGHNPALTTARPANGSLLAPDLDQLPFVNRDFFAEDPFRAADGHIEANMVGSRGCPYDCSFCGAAISANRDIRIRTRTPENLLAELDLLHRELGVTAVRFVDDLFLAHPRFMQQCLTAFAHADLASHLVWDATGRINILDRADDNMLDLMVTSGCREVALGIESGAERILERIDKRIDAEMTKRVVRRLTQRGINVKGYFILGLPTETRAEMQATVSLVHELWDIADHALGEFRASVFEFRPYPGTPDWHRLMSSGRYTAEQLLDYEHIDLTQAGNDVAMRERDEFNFSSNVQFGEATISEVRAALIDLTAEQDARRIAARRIQVTRPGAGRAGLKASSAA
jgi:anaerobic magnesium-protoporphyrin IX monomethyl ester cyclase